MAPLWLSALARSFLAGEIRAEPVLERAAQMLGRRPRWLRPLVRRFVAAFAGTRPRQKEVVRLLMTGAQQRRFVRVANWIGPPQRMQPVAAAAGWDLPAIESAGALAEWLGITIGELEWFADLKHFGAAHYHYTPLAKDAMSIRLIEAPKPRLKAVQRKILEELLYRIPPHPAAHGFVRGRSILTFVAPHVRQRVVMRLDLQNFFPSIRAARIQALFRTTGYPESVADLLGGICTHATPRGVWPAGVPAGIRELYTRRHLPQGAPTSPALANLCAWRADRRLRGLAHAAGAEYTRYADDLAFSGGEEFERVAERFAIHAAVILAEEGFTVHHRKTRVMRQGVRQHLAGLVTNTRANIMRPDFDRLKAILTNCVRSGPESQNRAAHPAFRAHLEGRIGFVESVNRAKGARLRRIFESIVWP